MALASREELSARQRRFPELWRLAEEFQRSYGGRFHLNWGAPFSVRTTVREGRLEIDVMPRRVLLRLEGLGLPSGVSFTTNPGFFGSSYRKDVGRPAERLGWRVQGGDQAQSHAIRRFLNEPRTLADLESLARRQGDWISVDPGSIFMSVGARVFERVADAVATMRRIAGHPRSGPRSPLRAPGPRFTGRPPSLAALRRWPNWCDCLDEEDEEDQDETTIRPDDDQDRIGPSTIQTAMALEYADGRKAAGVAAAAAPGDLVAGAPEVLYLLEQRSTRAVQLRGDCWAPVDGPTIALDDLRRLPLRASSTLPRSRRGRLTLVLGRGGSLRVLGRR